MNIICLITFQPNKIWCDFLNNFTKYKIFIIVDDNNFDLSEFHNYNNIKFIKVEDEKCKINGYTHVNFSGIKKDISGWDKALYYFSVENKDYEFIWFIEDDVFFYNEDTILKIDNQYIDEDLLSNNYYDNIDGNNKDWPHWKRINIKEYLPPYYFGLMCSVRFSKNMFNFINKYANTNKKLFFLEVMFPTIAIKNNLKYAKPNELKNIHYRHDFKKEDINPNNLYHPVKGLNNHIYFRS
jgi:hypothetical protein